MNNLFIDVKQCDNSLSTYFIKNNEFFTNILIINNAKTLYFNNFSNDKYLILNHNNNQYFNNNELILDGKEEIILVVGKEVKEALCVLYLNFNELNFNNLDLSFLNLLEKKSRKINNNELKLVKTTIEDIYKLRYKLHVIKENVYYKLDKKLINNTKLNELTNQKESSLFKLIKIDSDHYFYEAKNINNIINSNLYSLIEGNIKSLNLKIYEAKILNLTINEEDKNISEFLSVSNKFLLELNSLIDMLRKAGVKPSNDFIISHSFFNITQYKDYFLELLNSQIISYSNKLNSYYNFYNLCKVSNKELFKFLVFKEIENNFLIRNFAFIRSSNYFYYDFFVKRDLYLKGNDLKVKISVLKNRRYPSFREEFNFYPSLLIEVVNIQNEKIRNVVIDFSINENDCLKNAKYFKNLKSNELIGSCEFKSNSLLLGEERIELYLYVFLKNNSSFNKLVDLKDTTIKKYTQAIKDNLKDVLDNFFNDLLFGDNPI